jgi:hypothetical protein
MKPLEGEFQTFLVACGRSNITPAMVTRSVTADTAVKWLLNLIKLIEFAHGGFLWNFLRKPRWIVVTNFVEWNSSTQNAFLD